jgi:hypothetical protein
MTKQEKRVAAGISQSSIYTYIPQKNTPHKVSPNNNAKNELNVRPPSFDGIPTALELSDNPYTENSELIDPVNGHGNLNTG